MTPRQPRISGKDLVTALKRAGFIPVYIEGSHHYLEPYNGGALVTVPVHTNKILRRSTHTLTDQTKGKPAYASGRGSAKFDSCLSWRGIHPLAKDGRVSLEPWMVGSDLGSRHTYGRAGWPKFGGLLT